MERFQLLHHLASACFVRGAASERVFAKPTADNAGSDSIKDVVLQ